MTEQQLRELVASVSKQIIKANEKLIFDDVSAFSKAVQSRQDVLESAFNFYTSAISTSVTASLKTLSELGLLKISEE